jgi:hypothetical protein
MPAAGEPSDKSIGSSHPFRLFGACCNLSPKLNPNTFPRCLNAKTQMFLFGFRFLLTVQRGTSTLKAFADLMHERQLTAKLSRLIEGHPKF